MRPPQWLTKLRDSDTFYAAYDQGYVDDLTAGNLAGTMAWSGDVLYYKIWEGQPFEFIVPDDGALLWIDNMLIPANSANPAGALEMMDFFYKPDIAQMVTEWVLYMSPVPAVQDLIAQHAQGRVRQVRGAAPGDGRESDALARRGPAVPGVAGAQYHHGRRVGGLARDLRHDLGAVAAWPRRQAIPPG